MYFDSHEDNRAEKGVAMLKGNRYCYSYMTKEHNEEVTDDGFVYFDSGCEKHIFTKPDYLTSLKKLKGSFVIVVSGKPDNQITHVGKMGKMGEVRVSNINSNLYSLTQKLDEDGVSIFMNGG